MNHNQLSRLSFNWRSAGKRNDRYAVVLAGGDGSRLRSLTRLIAGDERPKQFCPILGGETLLDVTRRRAELKIGPENIFFSLTRKHEKFYRPLLAGVPHSKRIVQPENKGTAPAILYSLLRIEKIDPQAVIAFFPSDHYFSDDRRFMETVESAFRAVDFIKESIILLGIEPETAETSYGWIEPAATLFGDEHNAVSRVSRFWEKPSSPAAEHLLKKGCLWNSFVMVGRACVFLELFKKHQPGLFEAFKTVSAGFGTDCEPAAVDSLYERIDEVNFSSRILEKSAGDLYVQKVSGVAWSDWGEPGRVLGTLAGLGVRAEWMQATAA